MRVLFAVALLSVAWAARAADLPVGHSDGWFGAGQRAEMVWLYDDQPGVVVRTYWSAPWHDHHYYPYTGIAPRLGRYENLSAPSHPSKPAQTYRRTWNNNWAFEHSPVILFPPGDQTGIVNQDSLANQNDNEPNSRTRSRHRLYLRGHHTPHLH